MAALEGGRLSSPKQREGLAKLIHEGTKDVGITRSLEKIMEDVDLVFGESRAKLVNEALSDVANNPRRLYELITERAEAIREAMRQGSQPPKKP